MKTASKSEKIKAWRVEKIGNTDLPIYSRGKFNKAGGTAYRICEVADYSNGKRRQQSQSEPTEWKATALRHSFIFRCDADMQSVAQVALKRSPGMIFHRYREVATAEDVKL